MTLTEYPCEDSSAIGRIALNSEKRELVAQFRNSNDVYVYFGVNPTIEHDLAAGKSKGKLLNDVKQYCRFRKVKRFPSDVQMFGTGSESASFATQPSTINHSSWDGTYMGLKFSVTHGSNSNSTSQPAGNSSKQPASSDGLKKKAYRDYSIMWLSVLENPQSPVHDLQCLDAMLASLSKCHPLYPPRRKVPTLANANNAETGDISSSGSQCSSSVQLSNAFSELSMDDEEDNNDDDNDNNNDDDNGLEQERDENVAANNGITGVFHFGTGGERSIQARYLAVKIICSKVECLRNNAVSALRNREYKQLRLCWHSAWSTLFSCQQNIDQWYAILCQYSDNPDAPIPASVALNSAFGLPSEHANTGISGAAGAPGSAGVQAQQQLPDLHNLGQLQELFAGIELLSFDTEREKQKSLVGLQKSLDAVNKKLAPMLEDRDSAKARFGEDKWTSNPAPKQTFVERRRGLEKEHRDITAAMEQLQQLNFNIVGAAQGKRGW